MSAPAAPVMPEKGGQGSTDEAIVVPPGSSAQSVPNGTAETALPNTNTNSPPPNQNPIPISSDPPTYQDTTSRNRGGNGPASGGIEPAQQPSNVGPEMKYYSNEPNQQHYGPVMVTPLVALTEAPTMIDCPWCHRQAMTTTQKEGTPMQILAGAVLCLVCICLAPLPCIAGWCEDVNIMCSACRKRVATLPDGGAPIQLHLPPNLVQVPSQYQSHPPPGPGQAQVPSQYQSQPPPGFGQAEGPPQYPAQPPPAHGQGQVSPQQQPAQ